MTGKAVPRMACKWQQMPLPLSSSDQWCGAEEKQVIGAAGRAGGEARGLTLTTSKVEAAALGGGHPEVG